MNSYMKLANENAIKGVAANEGGPFGAVITDEKGNILASGNNQVLLRHDPTAHAEIVAIRNATQQLKTHDLSGCILYTSCEPCPMCLSAIIWANIKTVYFGCTKKDAASIGFRDDAIYEYLKGNRQDMLSLTEMDREACLTAFKEYQKEGKEIY